MRFALIWDLDGTLIDSYKMIVPSLREYYAQQGLSLDEADILRAVLQSSVRDFAAEIKSRFGISLDAGMARYQEIRAARESALQPTPHAVETLAALAAQGVSHFLYTHRGASTGPILTRLGLAPYFTEVVTAEAGFPRKPAPDALRYLIERHDLDRAKTRYIGDRALDIACAEAAGIGGILYRPPDSPAPPAAAAFTLSDLAALPPYMASLQII